MKKIIFPISVLLLLLSIAILAGCTKSSTSSNNPPTMPTSFASSQASRLAVNLSWGAAGADTFFVQRCPDSASWADLATTGSTSYNDSTISANRMQYFRVKGENAYGTSDYAYTSVFTRPGVWGFSTATDLGMFSDQDIDGGASYHTWTLDNGSGKLTITTPSASQRLVRVVTTDVNKMPNQGWFESKIKVAQWDGTGANASYASFFVEHDYLNAADNVVGIFFSGDSTVFGYYSSGSGDSLLHRVATNPTLTPLTSNTWHTIRLFHRTSTSHWDLYIDGNTPVWSGELTNVANGSYSLYEEWQFDHGAASNPTNQVFWIDEVANTSAVPTIAPVTVPRGPSNGLDMRGVAHRK